MIIVLSTTLRVNNAIPTNKPYCTEPLINDAVVSADNAVAIVNNTPAAIKQISEPTQSTMFMPAFKDGALISTKRKLSTPKTTARYRHRTLIISIRTGAPRVAEPANPKSEPQFRFKNVFNVKSSRVIFCADEFTKGMFKV